jgi:cytochrome b subunit of formate dehydrogenase
VLFYTVSSISNFFGTKNEVIKVIWFVKNILMILLVAITGLVIVRKLKIQYNDEYKIQWISILAFILSEVVC